MIVDQEVQLMHTSESKWKISYTHTHAHQSIATGEPKHQVYKEGMALLGVETAVLWAGAHYFNIAVAFHNMLCNIKVSKSNPLAIHCWQNYGDS